MKKKRKKLRYSLVTYKINPAIPVSEKEKQLMNFLFVLIFFVKIKTSHSRILNNTM